ncbi:MAG: CPBP family intramembrane metalloprotease [Oscillospiraceae bacterium]|nr:CPBP family intramembrane metalloprotease [Oscillospiraceae bacterium]
MTLTLTKQEKRRGWLYLAAQMLVIPFAVAFVCVLMGIASEADINLICFYVNAALAVIVFRELLSKSLENCRGRWKETLLTALKGFGLYWLVSTIVAAAILALKPDFANVNDQSIGAMLSERPLLMTIAVLFAAPLAEECLFRGWMFTGLAERSLPLAYTVTCAFFSAVHILPYIGTYDALTLLLCFVQYLAPSFVLCRTCQRNDSLCAPLLLHMTINTAALFVAR